MHPNPREIRAATDLNQTSSWSSRSSPPNFGRSRAFSGAPRGTAPELVRDQIGVMVNDVIAATAANITLAAGVENVDEVRAARAGLLGGFSLIWRGGRDLKHSCTPTFITIHRNSRRRRARNG